LAPIEKMKLLTLILLFVGLTNLMFGQTLEDKQTVIQMSIDLDELQQYYHSDKIEERKPLIIFNNGTVPANLRLTKFGDEVMFMLEKELFFYNKQAFLDFDKCEIEPTQADIIFRYDIEGLTVKLTFEKIDNNWTIKTKKLKEK
jgi:hypothetical protein